jgi:metallo-beta-lactamase class B
MFIRSFIQWWLGSHANFIAAVVAATGFFCLAAFSSEVVSPDLARADDIDENIGIRKSWDDWNRPVKPFKVIGNIYYVGPSGISSFLITTSQGNILLDTGFEETCPQICSNIARLGFKVRDIKIILNSHAHLDHCGGDAMMKSLTGAKIMMSKPDSELLNSGGTSDFTPYSVEMKSFPPATADRLLNDGDKVTLGDTALTCHLTPGHTKGCMTWTMDVSDSGRVYHVVYYGSTSLLKGVRLLGNPKYPGIVEDYRASFRKLKSLPCDIFLAPHAGFFNLTEKAKIIEGGVNPNPFIDPDGYQKMIETSEKYFFDSLEKEKQTTGR